MLHVLNVVFNDEIIIFTYFYLGENPIKHIFVLFLKLKV